MRVRFLGLWLPLVFACSGTNVVAGSGQTEAERIEAELPEWCANTCQGALACTSKGIDGDCEASCAEVIVAAIHDSTACAAAAGRLQKCYDAQGCAVYGDDRPCQQLEEAALACAGTTYYAEPSPPSYGYSAGSAGSANLGGPNAAPGYGPEVTCQGGFGGGSEVPEPGTTGVICEEGRFDCSDGSDYEMVCVVTSAGVRACSCLVDAVVMGAFGPGASCPTLEEMNAGCGWRLAEL